MKCRLIAKTVGVAEAKTGQELISYVARVSNPNNQQNFDTAGKLLKYCIDHGHVSIFEHAHLTIEIETSVAIATQILRHWSARFQQFSARYAEVQTYEPYKARRQDVKNRQNSIDDLPEDVTKWFETVQQSTWNFAFGNYRRAIDLGIAREQARFLLPQNATTKMYMTANARDWLFYIKLRTGVGVQLEHKEIAEAIKIIFCEEFPDIAGALGWTE